MKEILQAELKHFHCS